VEGLFEPAGSSNRTADGPGTPVPPTVGKALVVADGGASGNDIGLPLLPVANRPLLLRVLDSLAQAGLREVAVAVDPRLLPRMRAVVDAGRPWRFELSYLDVSSGEGMLGALGRWSTDGPVLLHCASCLVNVPLRSLLDGGTLDSVDAVVVVDSRRMRSPVVDLASERLAAVCGHRRSEELGALAGVAVLGSAAPDVARVMEAARAVELDLLTLVERMAELGGRVRARPVAACWRDSGGFDSALEANRFVLASLSAQPSGFDSRATVVEGPAGIDRSATLERSTVRGPVVVGPRARLVDSYIGPYTSIAADVCIEGAEIENSIVLSGTRISHLGGRLEASVIGPRARISRDFRLPRAMRLHVGEGARVSLA
jgi:glucose-1-phosphate thymidylyltransferase